MDSPLYESTTRWRSGRKQVFAELQIRSHLPGNIYWTSLRLPNRCYSGGTADPLVIRRRQVINALLIRRQAQTISYSSLEVGVAQPYR